MDDGHTLGTILVADANDNVVRRIAPDGMISTAAGTGAAGYNGDDISATAANDQPTFSACALVSCSLLRASFSPPRIQARRRGRACSDSSPCASRSTIR